MGDDDDGPPPPPPVDVFEGFEGDDVLVVKLVSTFREIPDPKPVPVVVVDVVLGERV